MFLSLDSFPSCTSPLLTERASPGHSLVIKTVAHCWIEKKKNSRMPQETHLSEPFCFLSLSHTHSNSHRDGLTHQI